MTTIQELLVEANVAVQQGRDAEQHTNAVFRKLEACRAATDPDAAKDLLRRLHDSLLPHDGAGMLLQTDSRDAVLCIVTTECLETVALLANVSATCRRLAQSLVIHYACCAPREAGILLLACLGRQVGLPTRTWEAADSVCLVALPYVVREHRRQRLRFLGDALGMVMGVAQSAIASMLTAPANVAASAINSSGAGSDLSAADSSNAQLSSLAADLQKFTKHVGAVAASLFDASEAEAIQHGIQMFGMGILGQCLLRSTAQASRNAGPVASAAKPLLLSDLLQPPQLLEIATGQLDEQPAAGCSNVAGIQRLLPAPEAEERSTADATAVGCSLAVLAVLCLPEGQKSSSPASADERMTAALQGAQVLLEAAAERQSEACGMAALALLSGTAISCQTLGQLAGEQLLGRVLHVAQLLMQTMVGHPAAGIRNAGFHALEDVLMALQPDVSLAALLQLLGCPVPSVAALLLHSVKQHFAACWPPDEAALAAVLQLLPDYETQLPQAGSGSNSTVLQGLLEAAESAGAAANVLVFLLLKASPADQLSQAQGRLLPLSWSIASRVQRLDALAGGSLAARILQPLREHSMRCLTLLEGAAAAASPLSAASPAQNGHAPAAGAATAAGATAAATAEVRGPAVQNPSFGAANEDTDAMLVVQRLIYGLNRALEVLRN